MQTLTPLILGESRCRWGKTSDSLIESAGVVATACMQGNGTQHGKPIAMKGSDLQPAAREGQAGSGWVAERSVVPTKPGNSGGGKGPQFKDNASRRKVRRVA